MCNTNIEHSLHVFFDCQFVRSCWEDAGTLYDMSTVTFTQDWLLHKLEVASIEELNIICGVLWGIWFLRNKRVWESKVVNPTMTMQGSFNAIEEWRKVRQVGSSKRSTQMLQQQQEVTSGSVQMKVC